MEEVIDQVRLDTHAVCQQIGHEELREAALLTQDTEHGAFVDTHDTDFLQDACGRHTNRLANEAGLHQKRPLAQHGDDGFFALLRHHGQLYLARLEIEHGIRRIPLRKDRVFLGDSQSGLPVSNLGEKCLGSNGGDCMRAMRITPDKPRVNTENYNPKILTSGELK